MAKFSSKGLGSRNAVQRIQSNPTVTVNHEGGLAFQPTAELELYLRSCATFLQDSFYRDGSSELKELQAAIRKVGDRSFVLKLANYVRNAMHLRSVPIVLLAEATRLGTPGAPMTDVRHYVPKILQRPDEAMELIGYWIENVGGGSKKGFPNSLKRGIADAIRGWVKVKKDGSGLDLYKLAKYWRGNAATTRGVKPKDVLRICHLTTTGSKADPVLAEVAAMVFNDKLPMPETWETQISAAGSNAENWDAIAPNMGIMALMRNCRNFEQKGATKAIDVAIAAFRNRDQVKNSRILPFRWFQASKTVTSQKIQDALRDAIDLSVDNVEKLPGTTAVFADNSGSMRAPISTNSQVHCIDVAAVMSALALHFSDDAIVGAFGSEFQIVPMSRRDSVLTNAQKVASANVGFATHAGLSLKYLLDNKIPVDRVFIFSDMQCYAAGRSYGSIGSIIGSTGTNLAPMWEQYRQKVNSKALMISVDLRSYGTLQFPQDDNGVLVVNGWSEKIFDIIKMWEARTTAVDEIRNNW